LYYSIYILLS